MKRMQRPNSICRKRIPGSALLLICAGLLTCSPGWTQTPPSINLQGRLVDSGALVNGPRDLEFRIYVAPASPIILYAETSTVSVVDGLYSHELGLDPLPPGTYPQQGPFPQPLYDDFSTMLTQLSTNKVVEVIVDGVPLTPRQPLSSVPYALFAEHVAADAIGASELQAGAVTENELAAGVAGDGLVGGGGSALAVNTDNVTLDLSRDALRIKPGGITTRELNLPSLDSRWVNRAGDSMTGDLTVNGDVRITSGGPAENAVLVSDATGKATWRPISDILLAENYIFTPSAFPNTRAELEIEGVIAGLIVDMVNGPGLVIDRIPGLPDSSGNNAEFDLVFDYSGPDEPALQNWFVDGTNGVRALNIIVRDGSQLELYRWNLYEYYLSNITTNGPTKRYTLRSILPPNSIADIDRTTAWLMDDVRDIPGDTGMEIEGVQIGRYPLVTIDAVAKTLTAYFTYQEGGGIWDWVKSIADHGTFNVGRKNISLIYERYQGGSGSEIGRNNFYECFPIRYQQIAGFDLPESGLECVVIAYEFAENAAGAALPLYQPPPVNYAPGSGGTTLAQDPSNNRCVMEIEGVFSTFGEPIANHPVILQGPGIEIERIPGFDGMGFPDDHSGLNREFPLVFDVPPAHATEVNDWRTSYFNGLPDSPLRRSMSLIVTDGSLVAEQFRFNLYEMIPADVTPTSNGYLRATLYVDAPPDMFVRVESASSSGYWGNNSVNNPATDTEVEIAGIVTGFFPEVTVDAPNRTLTLEFAFGEGEAIYDWVRQTAEVGTFTLGKRPLTVDPGGTATDYLGCFPISWQFHYGFERNLKCRQRVVLSYDQIVPP